MAAAGRLVLVALSPYDITLPMIDFPFRELDVLGVSCCNAGEFAEAIELVRRNATRSRASSPTSSPSSARPTRCATWPTARPS